MGGLKGLFHRKKSKKPDSGVDPPTAAPLNVSKTPSLKLRPLVEELEPVFEKFDVNGDGKISSSELGSILSNLGQETEEDDLRKMITEFDADGDGFIDFNEFVAMNTQGIDPDEAMENLREAFSVYDLDGNGSISVEELHKVLTSLGEHHSVSECRNMINGVDSDGDGTIDFDEFKVMMMMGARLVSMEGVRATTG